MDQKIIGFTISKFSLSHNDVDLFGVGLTIKELKHDEFFIYYWGIGDINRSFLSKHCFSLSFPLHASLLDRNVKVSFQKGRVIVENDWLGSIPVFYNINTGVVSTLINKVIDSENIEVDPDGFNNYLNFGFSVFEQTPIKNVKFMRYYSQLRVTDQGIREVEKKEVTLDTSKASSEIAIKNLDNYLNRNADKIRTNLIIPTSGGFDSRLLNSLITDKKRIRAFTYGVSADQSKSDEVVKAKEVAKKLVIQWDRIELKDFNKYCSEWYFLFGPAVHLHGMYHIEFYKKVLSKLKSSGGSVLSGFFGDVWSGNVVVPEIKFASELEKMGYTHDLRIDPKYSLLKNVKKLDQKFLRKKRRMMHDHNYRIVTAIRLKIILISYLISLPDYFGLPGWTPFLNFKVVKSILSLPKDEWTQRKWLRTYFEKHGMNIEDFGLKFDSDNCLEYEGLKHYQLENIDPIPLTKYLNSKFVFVVEDEYKKLVKIAKVQKNPLSIRFKKIYYLMQKSPYYFMKWYTYVTVLKSIELALKREK